MAEASGSGGAAPEPRSEQEVVQRFTAMRQEIQQLSSKINEMDGEIQEHELVLQALEPMDGSRKCFRLIGGVLVERTVAEVAPAVKKNKDNIVQFVANLEEQRETKTGELSTFQTKYKIRLKSEADAEAEDEKKSSGAGKGVLA